VGIGSLSVMTTGYLTTGRDQILMPFTGQYVILR
jgi:hypothetical protein